MNRSLDDWLDYIDAVHPRTIEMGLDRVTRVAERLKVTQPARQSVIVAGTNGKGSTCVALEHLLLAGGRSVGATLSPHVTRFNERIRIDGDELDDESLCNLFASVDEARGDVALTYFEFSTLAALLAFRKADVDVAILEVGLGGRLDAFNLVAADLAIVTSIGLDHEDYLGSDLEGIGREKAGVFRAGRPVVLGRVTDSVLDAARELACPVQQLGLDFFVSETTDHWAYSAPALRLDFPDLRRGALAPVNCALALTAARLLNGGFDPDAAGLAAVRLPGRMEQHIHQGSMVIVDVAHNPAAAEFLAGQLRQRYPGRRFVAIVGSLQDKDAAGVAEALADLVDHWLTIGTTGPRGQSAETLAARIGRDARSSESAGAALETAVSLTDPGGGILALGSFSAAEQVRKQLTLPSSPQSSARPAAMDEKRR